MKKRITVQDIADELGLSRNTVSKAINGTGNVSAETRNLIFQKAEIRKITEITEFIA